MAIRDKDLAGDDSASFNPVTPLFAGQAPVTTEEFTVKSGQGVCAKYQVMALEAASSQLVKHNPAGSGGAEVAVCILTQAVDATSAAVKVAGYTGGFFNEAALTWNAATNTLDKKKAVFARTPIHIGTVRL